MSNNLSLLFFILFMTCIPCLSFAEKQVLPPEKIIYDSKTFLYDKTWENDEAYLEYNLDTDPENEIVISYMASNREKDDWDQTESLQSYYSRTKNQIKIIQTLAFYQIYDKKPNGYYEAVKTIAGSDRLGKVFLIDTGPDKPKAIGILNAWGERSVNLEILQYKDGGYGIISDSTARLKDNNTINEPVIFDSGFVWFPKKNKIEVLRIE